MPKSVADELLTRKAQSLDSNGQSVARGILRDVIDEALEGRQGFAQLVTNGDESLLSKKLNGVGGRDFGLGDLERLPRDRQVQWLKRYGKLLGVKVTDIDHAEIAEEVMAMVERLSAMAKLWQVTRPTPVKAALNEKAERQVG